MLTNDEIKTATSLVIPKKYLNNLPSTYRGSALRTVKLEQVSETKVKLSRYSDYVTIQKIVLEYFSYGIKATVKHEANYRQPYQFTVYFTSDGIELLDNDGTSDRQKWTILKNNSK